MIWIRVSQWAIRIILVASFLGILVIVLFPGLTIAARITSIGVAFQIAGVAFIIPELAQRLRKGSATDLIIWAKTFLPLWTILSKVRVATTLGQLSVILSVMGIVLILVGLVMQYLAAYFN